MDSKSYPACDRHKNLQMIPQPLRRSSGLILGYVCPVPSCGRLFDGQTYQDGTGGGQSIVPPPQHATSARAASKS